MRSPKLINLKFVDSHLPPVTRHSSLVSSRGFTLLEILISLVLLIIVLGAVYSSFFTVLRAIERFDTVSLKYHEVRTALDQMRREIEGSFYKSSASNDPENNKTAFILQDRDIFGIPASVLHLSANSFTRSGSKEVLYFVKEKDDALALYKKETLPFALTEEQELPLTISDQDYAIEMLDDISGFSVESLIADEWIKTWDSMEKGTVPEIVRLSIEFHDNGQKVRLTEYARPKIGKQL